VEVSAVDRIAFSQPLDSVGGLARGILVGIRDLSRRQGQLLVVPETAKAPRAESDVADRMPNVTVAKIGLDGSKIRSPFRQVVPAGVPECVRVHIQGSEARPFRHAINHQLHPSSGERSATLRGKNVIRYCGTFSFEAPEGTNFESAQALIARYGAFRPLDMDNPLIEIKLVPAGLQTLLNAQPVGEQSQNESAIPEAVPVFSRRLDEFLNFAFQEVLPGPRTPERHYSLNANRYDVADARIPQHLHRVASLDCTQKVQKGNS
jgi:hypothetical protein